MKGALILPRTHGIIRARHTAIPALIAHAGDQATTHFIEFFTAQIPNANTGSAYFRTATAFLDWAENV